MCKDNRKHFTSPSHVWQWSRGYMVKEHQTRFRINVVSTVAMTLAWFQCLRNSSMFAPSSSSSLHPALFLAPRFFGYRCVSFEDLLPSDPSVILRSSYRSALRLPSEFPCPCGLLSTRVPLHHLSPLRRTPLLPRSMLSCFAVVEPVFTGWPPTCATRPGMLFRETRPPAKPLST